MKTVYRKAEEDEFRKITLSGKIVDLGGLSNSSYRNHFKGTYTITSVDGPGSVADITCDLEEALPISSQSYNGVLMMNVLEHIYNYRELLAEAKRILSSNGTVVIATPFMFPYHPSPNDFHRYTAKTLERALTDAGFVDIHIIPTGTGVFATRWLMLERLLPARLRFLSSVGAFLSSMSDSLFSRLARATGKSYVPSDYALGFVTIAHAP